MTAWWNSLDVLQKIFAYMAIPATVILLIQTLLLLFGLGDQGDGNHDFDHDHDFDHNHDGQHDGGLRIFTVRAFVAFFSVAGWCGLALSRQGTGAPFSILVALLAGVAAMLAVAYILKGLLSLQTSGNLQTENAVGKSGTVYLTIPANRKGTGKINLLLQGRYVELEAVTDQDTPIATNTEVIVISVSGQNIVAVIPR